MKLFEEILQNLWGAFKFVTFLLAVAFGIPVVLLYRHYRPQDPYTLPRLFHKFLLFLFGIKVRVIGEPTKQTPVLFVANHVSYLDIPVLGAYLPASFIAKSEVASWPLFGSMAKAQNTVFIERKSTRAADQCSQLQEHLANKKNLILFPEGTSSDGTTALPFKSSLFNIVEASPEGTDILVQPISLTCTELDGMPILLEERPLYAWYGDMTLTPHLWAVFKRGHFTVELIFHTPLSVKTAGDRKQLAAACQAQVARGIEASLNGHGTQALATA